MDLITTPDTLLEIIKRTTEGLLEERFEHKAKKYDKIDFKVIDDGNQFLYVQVTKCSPGYPNLKFLLTHAMKKKLNSRILKKHAPVAVLQIKSPKTVRIQRVICSRNSSFSLIDDDETKPIENKEYRALKHYIAIKFLLKIEASDWKKFASLLRCYIMYIEQIHRNVKFVFRKEDKIRKTYIYIYRNKVKMDDIILSCNILSSSCEKIFQMSQDVTFQNDLANKFGLKKKKHFKRTLGNLLYAQANKNFNAFNM